MELRIKNYYYQSIDDSILAPYYKKMCNIIINFVPANSSPNVLTLIGLFGVFLSTFVTIFLKDTFGLLYTCIICSSLLFFYQIMDTLDGMQGKRVNMYYNPTTELFDHGCDSITACCVLYNLLYLSNLIENHFIISMLITILSITNFYLPTWQHSNTGTMHFRSGMANPTESIFMIKIFYLIIGLFSDIITNIYPVIFVLVGLLYLTAKNYSQCYGDTFFDDRRTNYEKFISLAPLFLSYMYTFYLLIFYTNEINYINIISPFLIAILNLIWYEISGNDYNIFLILIVYAANIADFTFGIYFFVTLYLYTFYKYTRIMCDILGMEHFYSVNI